MPDEDHPFGGWDPPGDWRPPPAPPPFGARPPQRFLRSGLVGAPGQRPPAFWIAIGAGILGFLYADNVISTIDFIIICCIIPSIILHEISHGFVAKLFGDDTAKRAGRLTLNPLAHIDILGTIIVPVALTLLHSGTIFGWAKPVPVNTSRLRGGRNSALLVSLAGPATNFILAGVAYGIFKIFGLATTIGWPSIIVFIFGYYNIWLGIFNLIPVPPLDGSAVLERFLPARLWPRYLRIRPYSMLILVGFILLSSSGGGGPFLWLHSQIAHWWVGHTVGT